jgi:hypothetical protein
MDCRFVLPMFSVWKAVLHRARLQGRCVSGNGDVGGLARSSVASPLPFRVPWRAYYPMVWRNVGHSFRGDADAVRGVGVGACSAGRRCSVRAPFSEVAWSGFDGTVVRCAGLFGAFQRASRALVASAWATRCMKRFSSLGRVSRAAKCCGPSGPHPGRLQHLEPDSLWSGGAPGARTRPTPREREAGPGPSMGDHHGSGMFRCGSFGWDNAKRGRQTERFCRLRERSKPLKGKAQGRHRRETKPEGLREERNVRRLRKSEGVAQSGEANPA